MKRVDTLTRPFPSPARASLHAPGHGVQPGCTAPFLYQNVGLQGVSQRPSGLCKRANASLLFHSSCSAARQPHTCSWVQMMSICPISPGPTSGPCKAIGKLLRAPRARACVGAAQKARTWLQQSLWGGCCWGGLWQLWTATRGRCTSSGQMLGLQRYAASQRTHWLS